MGPDKCQIIKYSGLSDSFYVDVISHRKFFVASLREYALVNYFDFTTRSLAFSIMTGKVMGFLLQCGVGNSLSN